MRAMMVGLATLLAVGTSCGVREQRPQEGPGIAREQGGPPIDWEHPYGGPQFKSLAEAEEVLKDALPFTLIVPRWGQPDIIEILPDAAEVPPEARVVGLIYHLPDEGTVLVEEQLQGAWTLEHLKEMADTNYGTLDGQSPQPVAGPDPFQLVDIRSTKALLIQGNGVGRIIWLENGLRFDITGPTVSPEEVISLAERL